MATCRPPVRAPGIRSSPERGLGVEARMRLVDGNPPAGAVRGCQGAVQRAIAEYVAYIAEGRSRMWMRSG